MSKRQELTFSLQEAVDRLACGPDNTAASDRHGLTRTEHAEMVVAQGAKCAICLKDVPRLDIDHNHKTGVVRGLLCSSCNVAIGFMCDNPDTLRAAADYVERNG